MYSASYVPSLHRTEKLSNKLVLEMQIPKVERVLYMEMYCSTLRDD